MNRIAYFGTWGKPGHFFRAIEGRFNRGEEDTLSLIDCHAFTKHMEGKRYSYVECNTFLGYAVPYSIDDPRPGSFAVIFVEFAETPQDIINALDTHPELKRHFLRRLPDSADFRIIERRQPT